MPVPTDPVVKEALRAVLKRHPEDLRKRGRRTWMRYIYEVDLPADMLWLIDSPRLITDLAKVARHLHKQRRAQSKEVYDSTSS
jgi:hypothetical protein